jgi:hypothetical protein
MRCDGLSASISKAVCLAYRKSESVRVLEVRRIPNYLTGPGR